MKFRVSSQTIYLFRRKFADRWRYAAALSGSVQGVMLLLKRQLEHCGNPFRDKVPPRGINISDARCCDAAFTHAVAG